MMLVPATHAGPLGSAETWIVPSTTLMGAATGSRFGDAIACSKATATTSNRSFVAVGAPNATVGGNSQAGRVYIFDPTNSASALQSLTSPSGGANYHFGASVAFFPDVNADSVDELAVGEPGADYIHIFSSQVTGGSVTYSSCISLPGSSGAFGTTLVGLRGPFASGATETLVVSAPGDGSVYGLDVSAGCGSPPSYNSRFVSLLNGGNFGKSLAEIADGAMGAGDGATDVLVGQPDYVLNDTGKVVVLSSAGATPTPVALVNEPDYGIAVGGHYSSQYFAVGSPQRSTGVGGIDVFAPGTGIECAITHDILANSIGFGSTVAHLHTSFPTLFAGVNQATFATSRSQTGTGGSIGLFALTGSYTCSQVFQVNNCAADNNQEQGKAIVGGTGCQMTFSGTPKHILLFGSPGYNSGQGRVDIIVSGDELGSAQSCDAPTATPTATPTAPPTNTPTPTPTNTPNSLGEAQPTATPIPFSPGSANVPAPTVEVQNKLVTVILPAATPTLSPAQEKAAIKLLIRSGLKPAQAKKALDKGLVITNEITITPLKSGTGMTRAFTTKVIVEAKASAAKKRQYKTRLTRIAIRNLPKGTYSVTYKGTISTKKPSVVIGSTKPSAPTRFTVN